MINNTIIATMGLTNTSSLNILQIIHDIDTRVLVQSPDGQLHNLKLYYNNKGVYFNLNGRYYLDEFTRV